MAKTYEYNRDDLIKSIKETPRLSSKTTWDLMRKKMDEFTQKEAIDFVDWLMTNCEIAKDQSLWSYGGDDYSLEGIYKLFKS